MNKKGFIFTFISVTLISVIVLAFLIQYTSRTKVEIEKTNVEIETMNSFVRALDKDYLPRALRISGNQAILALLHHMDVNDIYAGQNLDEDDERDDIQAKKIIINAMIDGKYKNGWGMVSNALILEMMEVEGVSYNLSSVLKEIVNLANFTGITLEILNDINSNEFKREMDVYQEDPWYITVSMKMEYKVYNKDEDILWDFSDENIKTISTRIPVYYFRDPIYMIAKPEDEEPREVNITINKTVYTLPEQINDHVVNTVFKECQQSPDFLKRIQGLTDSSPNGIESLIDVKDPSKSSIDYQYIFDEHGDLVSIGESGYYIDETHSACYNI